MTPLEIFIQREAPDAEDTLGVLFIDDRFKCFTIEDTLRERPGQPVESWKVAKQTAIPAGRYRVLVTFSNRFQRPLPELQDVPGFTGIRIHPGNTSADTEGCLLPGLVRAGAAVQNSRSACEVVQSEIDRAIADGREVWCTIAQPRAWWAARKGAA